MSAEINGDAADGNINDNSNNNNNNNNNNRHACAACKFQRRKCNATCLLHPYFPGDKAQEFAAAHKMFGVKNMTKKLAELKEIDRPSAVASILWEANAWQENPIFGPLGLYRNLEGENQQLKNHIRYLVHQLQQQNHQTKALVVAPPSSSDIATNYGVNIHNRPLNGYPMAIPITHSNGNSMPSEQDSINQRRVSHNFPSQRSFNSVSPAFSLMPQEQNGVLPYNYQGRSLYGDGQLLVHPNFVDGQQQYNLSSSHVEFPGSSSATFASNGRAPNRIIGQTSDRYGLFNYHGRVQRHEGGERHDNGNLALQQQGINSSQGNINQVAVDGSSSSTIMTTLEESSRENSSDQMYSRHK